MVEFLVALAVLLPLFAAVAYAGRYADVQQTAVQASRYAALQRVMEPNSTRLPDTLIQDQMRARFFMTWDALNKQGGIRSDDTAASARGAATQPAMWNDLQGKPLLSGPDQVRLSWAAADMAPPAPVNAALVVLGKIAGKTYTGAHVAQVDVSLVNRMDQATAHTSPLRIGAATAAAGNGWGSSGRTMTVDSAKEATLMQYMPSAVSDVVGVLFSLVEDSKLELGCMKPDVVPTVRLERYAPAGPCQ